MGETLIDADDEIDGAAAFAGDSSEITRDERRCRCLDQVRHQLPALIRVVFEGKLFRVRREEEIERIDHRHLGNQIDFDSKLTGLVRKYQPRQIVCLRVLLPIDEMTRRLHLERIAQNPRTAMRGRAQPHHMRAQAHQSVIAIVGDVIQGNMDRQGFLRYAPRRCITKRGRRPF